MNWLIVTYLSLGLAFGVATVSRRHLFSEGPARAPDDKDATLMDGPAMWLLTSAVLWPLLALSGAYGAWYRHRKSKR